MSRIRQFFVYNGDMKLFIDTDDRFGHHFGAGPILAITMQECDVQELLKTARGRTSVCFATELNAPLIAQPEEIYLCSEESWYAVRFHDFRCEQNHLSFVIHFLKAMYMASADLTCFAHKNRQYDIYGRQLWLFSDKVDQSGKDTEHSTGDDVVEIMDTAEHPDIGFAKTGEQQQDTDAFVDLQDGHGDDHA